MNTDNRFAAMRDQLEALQRELRSRVDALEEHLREPLEADFEEQAAQLENRDVELALDAGARTELVQVERALAQMTNGNYGTCERCGETIPFARLEAQPFASTCIHCAEAGH